MSGPFGTSSDPAAAHKPPWRLGSAWWGKGLATEAAMRAVDFGFTQLGLTRIISILESANVRSMRVVDKLGMKLERQTIHPELGLPLVVYEIAPT